ncbi:uncharacterized protein C56G2.4-like [Mytilus galloprovincialis]|uniref:uncharacterized protein C56G2.4-like n=1 Tax=Mytilus galloprovincialis TaxID=29158 RepID=UPI003F7BBECA
MLILVLLSTIIVVVQCCEPIREPICQMGIPYNSTVFPNLAGHLFQGGASVGLQRIKSLIEKKCSPNIREFLCRVYMPECSSSGKPVIPSWEMCQEAHEGCSSMMSSLGFSWDSSLNCSKFEAGTIDRLKEIANDKLAFWFGTGVKSLCSKERPTFACKMNRFPSQTDSIISRFGGSINISGIDRLMKIQYTYENGTVNACKNDFSLPGGSLEVDPLSPTVNHGWQLRNLPAMKWTAKSSDYFTLVLYDIGFTYLHALYVNIPGSNITNADEVHQYRGPGNPTDVANPYVYLLYKQHGHLQLTDPLRQSLNKNPLETLHNESNFYDLKSISWVRVSADPFSIGRLEKEHQVNNCPLLVSEALQHQDRPFLPHHFNLNMSVDVTYSPSAITFTSCCKTHAYRETSVELNPIGNMTVKTAHVRSSIMPSVTLTKQDPYFRANKFSDDELYSLIMVDPDVPIFYKVASNSHPLIHWMVINIPRGNVNNGVTVREYRGPQPSSGVHTYYFLLYLQSSRISPSVISNYTTSCTRCLFDINGFTTDHGLKLTGATWFRAEYDEYVRHQRVDESGKDEAAECAKEPQYPQSCSGVSIPHIIG